MDFAKDKPLYTTKIVADMLEITTDRLRTYDEELVMKPYREKSGQTTRRLYSQQDVEWLQLVRELMNKYSYNLASIRTILSLLYQMKADGSSIPAQLESFDTLNALMKNPNLNTIAIELLNK